MNLLNDRGFQTILYTFYQNRKSFILNIFEMPSRPSNRLWSAYLALTKKDYEYYLFGRKTYQNLY